MLNPDRVVIVAEASEDGVVVDMQFPEDPEWASKEENSALLLMATVLNGVLDDLQSETISKEFYEGYEPKEEDQ